MTKNSYILISRCLLILAFGAYANACKQRSASSETKATYDETNVKESDWTRKRLVALGNYAADLLKFDGNEAEQENEHEKLLIQRFKEAGVVDPRPLSTYTIELGPYKECFGGDEAPSLYWNRQRNALKSQIDQVAIFIRDFHYSTLGRYDGPFAFKTILLCQYSKVGASMALDQYVLKIGLKPSLTGTLSVYQSQDLLDMWQNGVPAGITAKTPLAQKMLWGILNPLSFHSRQVRKLMHENSVTTRQAAEFVLKKISNLKTGDLESALTGMIQDETKSPAVSSEKLDQDSARKLQLGSTEQKKKFYENMKCFGEDSGVRAELESQTMSMIYSQLSNSEVETDREVTGGLFAIDNHIDAVGSVSFSTASTPYANYFGTLPTRKIKIKTVVRAGILAFDTSDEIIIDLRLDFAGKAFRTAAVDASVKSALTNVTLCK